MSDQQLHGSVMRDYDELIAALRQSWISQGLTQGEVAARIGHSAHVDISRWLSGARTASGPSLFDLVYALGHNLALTKREDA